jgi:hypothetical protein
MSTDARLGQLERAVTSLTEALTRLAEAQAKTDEALTRLTERVDELAMRMDQLVGVVGNMRGDLLELRYRQHAVAYFAPFLRGIQEVTPSELDRMAEDAERAGRLTEADHLDLLRADLVLMGNDRQSLAPAYLVVEISAVLDSQDVERAARRADLLEKAVGVTTLAVVAGEGLTQEATHTVALRREGRVIPSRMVRVVVDGRVTV